MRQQGWPLSPAGHYGRPRSLIADVVEARWKGGPMELAVPDSDLLTDRFPGHPLHMLEAKLPTIGDAQSTASQPCTDLVEISPKGSLLMPDRVPHSILPGMFILRSVCQVPEACTASEAVSLLSTRATVGK